MISGTAQPSPPGMNSITVINASLQSLMIGHTFLVLLIPLLVALFYYSTPCGRRQPIFILDVLALTLGLIIGLLSDVMHIHAMLSPQNVWSAQLQLSIGFTGAFQTMLVDAILLVRLITVHPLFRIGLVRFVCLMFLPVTLKIARVVNMTLFIYRLSIIARAPNVISRIDATWLALPYVKIDWIAQVVDNSYVSIAFLWTLRGFGTNTASHGVMSTVTFGRSSLAERIRILSRLALSNFIIPSLISIVQLIVLFRIGNSNPIVLNDIATVNAMVSVIGVVFATVWAGKEHRQEAKVPHAVPPVEHGRWCPRGRRAESTVLSAGQPCDPHELLEG